MADGIALGLVVGVRGAGAVLFTTGYSGPNKPTPTAWFGITAARRPMPGAGDRR